jgi:hypothetical protein
MIAFASFRDLYDFLCDNFGERVVPVGQLKRH